MTTTAPVSKVGEFAGNAFWYVREAGATPFRVLGALSSGAEACGDATKVASKVAALPTSSTWSNGFLESIINFASNGKDAIVKSDIFGKFWTGISKFNFKGLGLGEAFGKLGGSGYGMLALAVLPALYGATMVIHNLIVDGKTYNDAAHGRCSELISSPTFHATKFGTDILMGAGVLAMLGGKVKGGWITAGFGLAGMLACKAVEYLHSPNNPMNNEGANIWAPFNWIFAAGKTHSATHSVNT